MMAVPTVAVVGGGVVGCAVAYHLSRAAGRDAMRILVLDPQAPTIASAASSRSAGCVIGASDAPEKVRLTAQTVTDVGALERLLRTDLGYRRSGCLRLATDAADLARLARQAEVTTKAVGGGLGATVVGREAAERRAPWLRCPELRVAGALWTEGDGVLDPTVLAGAYLRAARALGTVELRPVAAARFEVEGERVVGVVPSEGSAIACDYAVNAAGAWAGLLAAGLGELPGLPMAPTRSHYWLSQSTPSQFDGSDPIVIMPGARAYTRPEGMHGCLLGLQEEVSLSWDAHGLPSPAAHPSLCADLVSGSAEQAQDALLNQLEELCEFFPAAAEIGWGHYTAGLSTYTVDGEYLIGGLPGISGLSVATGCNGSMLSASGGVGRMVAAQVMQDLGLCGGGGGAVAAAAVGAADAAGAAGGGQAPGGTLPAAGADCSTVLTALGAQRYAPARFLEQGADGRRRWDVECGGGDVFSEEFRAQCAARRGAKFRSS